MPSESRTLITTVEVVIQMKLNTPVPPDAKLGPDLDRWAMESREKAHQQVREGLQGFSAQQLSARVVGMEVTVPERFTR